MSVAANAPSPALQQWLRSSPAVRCVAPAFRTWTGAPDAAVVPVTPVSGERFAATGFHGDMGAGMTVVAGTADDVSYALANVPSAGGVMLHAQATEDSFTAFAPAPKGAAPRAVATLAEFPHAGAVALGASRATVERALGPGHAKTLCGYDVVRYEVRPREASVAEMWLFYRAGRVAALARYEAV